MKKPRVIDFRVRPRTPELISMYHYPGTKWGRTRNAKTRPLPVASSIKEFLQELDDAGIEKAVFTGRDLQTQTGWRISNDHIADVVKETAGRVIGFGGIDPMMGTQAIAEIERSIGVLGLTGIAIDPGAVRVAVDDVQRMYSIYRKCVELGVPLVITCGPNAASGGYITNGWPIAVDRVAVDFPELVIICSHGGWPFTAEMVAVAWRNPNVYFENSVYHHMPGSELVVQAANHNIPDKVVYASAYPIVPLKEGLERFMTLPFKPEVLQQVLYDNAARILGLPIESADSSSFPGTA